MRHRQVLGSTFERRCGPSWRAPGIPDGQKPVHEVRLGSIKAVVWRNDSEFGPRYKATFSRLYQHREQNARSLQSGFLLLSVYPAGNSVRFRILTGAVRSSTAVLLPEDYYLLKEDKNHAGIARPLG